MSDFGFRICRPDSTVNIKELANDILDQPAYGFLRSGNGDTSSRSGIWM